MAYLIETLVRCACTQTGTHARMYNTHTHCFLCHSIPPCTHGRDMLYVYTTLHVTTCLWNIGLVKLAKIISSVQITLSLYPYTSPSHLMLPLHPLTSPSYFILSPHLWPHPPISPSHLTLPLYPLTLPSHLTLPPQEALLADYTESRRVGSPEFNTQVADVFIRCTSWVSQKWCLFAFNHNARTTQTHTYKILWIETQVSLRTCYAIPISTGICTLYKYMHLQ